MAMADGDQVQGKSWNINHYIFAGLCATLIVTAVITVTSIVLSPVPVIFSVTRATSKTLPNYTSLMVTIAVYNPSRRCQARYQSVSIRLFNSSTQTGGIVYIYGNVPENTFPMDYVRGPHTTLVNSTADLVEEENDRAWADRLSSGAGLTVEVTAQVRFKVGVPTRLYDMKVFCPSVLFTDEKANANQSHFNCSG